MSALLPPGHAQPARRDGEAGATERERALLLELSALRAENEHLRQRYAQHINRQPSPANDPGGRAGEAIAPHAELPLPLEATLEPTEGNAQPALVQYEALFATLGSVFPIGIFRTDEAGVLTQIGRAHV